MDNDFKKLWNKIKSKDFKSMILNKYDFEPLTYNNLIELIHIYRDFYKLKIKV